VVTCWLESCQFCSWHRGGNFFRRPFLANEAKTSPRGDLYFFK
jgi:hypothetical protein